MKQVLLASAGVIAVVFPKRITLVEFSRFVQSMDSRRGVAAIFVAQAIGNGWFRDAMTNKQELETLTMRWGCVLNAVCLDK